MTSMRLEDVPFLRHQQGRLGSKLQQIAERDGFRRVFLGWPNIGGRYSVLSDFGLVPAAIMGVDVGKFLDRTD